MSLFFFFFSCVLFCSSFYVYFVCSFPLGLWLNSRAFLENYLLACKIRNSSAEETEKSTPPPPGDKEDAGGSLLPLEDGWVVIRQVTAADKLRDLNGFRDG